MAAFCDTNNEIDFTEGSINLKKMRVGGSYAILFTFSGTGIDITLDDFTLTVYDLNNDPVGSPLGVGTGLIIVSPTELQALIGPPTTDVAGTYRYILEWEEIATGADAPVVKGIITVRI